MSSLGGKDTWFLSVPLVKSEAFPSGIEISMGRPKDLEPLMIPKPLNTWASCFSMGAVEVSLPSCRVLKTGMERLFELKAIPLA